MVDTTKIQLRIPEQDLRYLTVGDTNPRKMQAWVEHLPMMNVGETSRQLYQLMQELNRVQIDPKLRFALLEILRPAISHVCNGLSKHYLNQPVVLPERERKILNLAQSLQSNLANGYKICVAHASQKVRDKELKNITAVSVHRAISALTQTLLRCLQLYFHPPKGVWLELHQLYHLATYHALQDIEVEDSLLKKAHSTTVSEVYARALALGGCRSNQLRQNEITLAYEALEEWCALLKVDKDAQNALFVVNPTQDIGPQYLKRGSEPKPPALFLQTTGLIDGLQKAANGDTSVLKLPDKMMIGLVSHLIHAWGASSERSFRRIDCRTPVRICLGLSATHHFISEGKSFATQLTGGRKSVIVGDASSRVNEPSDGDAWSSAFDGGKHSMAADIDTSGIDLDAITQMLQEEETSKDEFRDYGTIAINGSPGGYCLQWTQDVPTHLRTGEIVGIRESGQRWSIGVIRWVKQIAGAGAQFGVELLSPRAEPVGARVVLKTGEKSQYQRCLLLPELAAIGQPATLITPAVMFSQGSKVHINRNGSEDKVTLMKARLATASVSQFQFKGIGVPVTAETPAAKQKPSGDGDDFDSIWSSL